MHSSNSSNSSSLLNAFIFSLIFGGFSFLHPFGLVSEINNNSSGASLASTITSIPLFHWLDTFIFPALFVFSILRLIFVAYSVALGENSPRPLKQPQQTTTIPSPPLSPSPSSVAMAAPSNRSSQAPLAHPESSTSTASHSNGDRNDSAGSKDSLRRFL